MFKLILETYKNLSKSEKWFLFFASLIILLLSSAGFIYGQIIKENLFYIGLNTFTNFDIMVYLSQIEEAGQGHLITHNLYTSEPQIGYISPLWLILGWFSRLTTMSPLITFHFFRIFLGFIFLFLLYLFISQIFSNTIWRKISFLTLSFASGLGVFSINGPWDPGVIFKNFGTDLWLNESNTFLTLSHSPLYIFSQLSLLMIFWWVIAGIKKSNYIATSFVGLFVLLFGIIHPFDMVIVYAVLGAWFLFILLKGKKWDWVIFFKLGLIYSVSFLSLAYFLMLKHYDQTFASWSTYNISPTPSLRNYIIGFGFIFLAFLFGIYPSFTSKNKYLHFLLIWAISYLLILHLPFSVQRRFSNGMQIPLVIIGMVGINFIYQKIKVYIFKYRNISIIVASCMVLLSITSMAFKTTLELIVLKPKLMNYYWPTDSQSVFDWLKRNTPPTSVILSAHSTGAIMPAYTARYSYIGYDMQTYNNQKKKDLVNNWFFYTNTDDRQKMVWLRLEGVDYVFWGELERNIGNFNPKEKNYLELVYQNSDVEIYKVK